MSKTQTIPPGALPSLNALRTFEAVVRKGGVTSAAAELCVTQGAVSHQIGLLEEWFGVPLLRRQGRGVGPTAAGRELADAATAAFAGLSEACARLAGEGGRELDLAAPSSFLSRWLVPRLEGFEAVNPGILLRMRTDGGLDDLRTGRLDALVLCEDGPLPEWTDGVEVAPERVGPVCAARWSRGAGSADWIATVPRLATDSRQEAWKEWAKASGVRIPNRGKVRRFDHLGPMLEAVRAGLGVAVVPEILVRRELDEGVFRAPCGFESTGKAFVLATRADRAGEAGLESAKRWFSRAGIEAGSGTSGVPG